VNLKGFFVTALGQALELSVATPEDVLRHVTPDVLSQHLPRALWARLLTACMGAPRVDAQLVVETIGVPNLCEHVPSHIIWGCIQEIAQRSLGQPVTAVAPSASAPLAITPPPPPTTTVAGPPNPLADVVASLDGGPPSPPLRARSSTGQRFRSNNTGIGRLAASNRRPQAAAAAAEPAPRTAEVRRGATESDYDVETTVGKEDWKAALAVEDEQLVDWSAAEETVTHDGERDGYGRKR
jgi:hypothetical protein